MEPDDEPPGDDRRPTRNDPAAGRRRARGDDAPADRDRSAAVEERSASRRRVLRMAVGAMTAASGVEILRRGGTDGPRLNGGSFSRTVGSGSAGVEGDRPVAPEDAREPLDRVVGVGHRPHRATGSALARDGPLGQAPAGGRERAPRVAVEVGPDRREVVRRYPLRRGVVQPNLAAGRQRRPRGQFGVGGHRGVDQGAAHRQADQRRQRRGGVVGPLGVGAQRLLGDRRDGTGTSQRVAGRRQRALGRAVGQRGVVEAHPLDEPPRVGEQGGVVAVVHPIEARRRDDHGVGPALGQRLDDRAPAVGRRREVAAGGAVVGGDGQAVVVAVGRAATRLGVAPEPGERIHRRRWPRDRT